MQLQAGPSLTSWSWSRPLPRALQSCPRAAFFLERWGAPRGGRDLFPLVTTVSGIGRGEQWGCLVCEGSCLLTGAGEHWVDFSPSAAWTVRHRHHQAEHGLSQLEGSA